MATEIEHRFLLAAMPSFPSVPLIIEQGYWSDDKDWTTRIRRIENEAFLTMKGPKHNGAGPEIEFPMPVDKAIEALKIKGPQYALSKNRYEWAAADNLVWEIDEFTGRHQGLVIAEIELPCADTPYDKPDWLENAVNITEDFRFANAALVKISRTEMIANIQSVLEAAGFGVTLT